MSFAIATIAANLASLACVIFAGLLAYQERPGWGWFLFVGLLCAGSVKFGSKSSS